MGFGRQRPDNLQFPLFSVGKIFGEFIPFVLNIKDLEEFPAFFVNPLFFPVIAGLPKNPLHAFVFHIQMVANPYVIQNRQVFKKANILEGPRHP